MTAALAARMILRAGPERHTTPCGAPYRGVTGFGAASAIHLAMRDGFAAVVRPQTPVLWKRSLSSIDLEISAVVGLDRRLFRS